MPGARTALLVTAGFDYGRVRRLVGWYEPAKLLIGVQVPSLQSDNDIPENVFKDYFRAECDVEIFEVDAFADDRGRDTISKEIGKIDKSFNILISSLGPKVTAISVYGIQRSRPEIGLVYAPSNEFNESYSSGIGESYKGVLS